MLKLYDENNKLVSLDLEKPEQLLVQKYIKPDDVVLELGARYSSVSCTINRNLKNKKNQISVEPDSRVWEALQKNRNINGCQFRIVKGFISRKRIELTQLNNHNGFGSTFEPNNTSITPHFTLNDIIEIGDIKFNVLVADCEGFLEKFYDENKSSLPYKLHKFFFSV